MLYIEVSLVQKS